MKWSKETIISIIIVLLFVGSIFGMAIGSGSRKDLQNNEGDTNATSTNPDENLPTELFSTFVDANVLEVYPQFVVVSNTNIYDQTTLDNKLREIDGIKKNTISFNKGEDQNITTLIKIVFDLTKRETILEDLQKTDYLLNPQIFESASLTMPTEKITLNGDNNKTREYQFAEDHIDGVIGIDTKKGDELTAEIQVVFKGNTPIKFLAIEYQNKSTNPQLMATTKTITIKEWMPAIRVYATSPITKEFDVNEINDILGDENLTIGRSVEGSLTINLENNEDENSINSYLEEIKDENDTVIKNIAYDGNLTNIEFEMNLQTEKYESIKNKLLEYGIGATLINSEPNNIYRIEYNIDEINLDIIKKKLVANGLELKYAEKNASFDVPTIEYQGKTLEYDANTSNAWLLYPDDLNKTEANLIVQGYYSRNKLWFIELKENRE